MGSPPENVVAQICKYLSRAEILDIGEDPSYYIGKNTQFSNNKDLQNGKLWDIEAKKRLRKEQKDSYIYTDFWTKNDELYEQIFIPHGLRKSSYATTKDSFYPGQDQEALRKAEEKV